MPSVPEEPHPLAPTPTPPPPPPPPPPIPELPPYTIHDPHHKTPRRPDLDLPPPYASVVQETYTNNGFQGEGHAHCQSQRRSQGQGNSQGQPQCHVNYHRGPPFNRCRLQAMHELDVDHELSTSFEQYNQCSYDGMPAPYPQHVTIIRDSQARIGAPINATCLIGFSAFVICCCCAPFGMAAMVKALEVRSRLRAGDITGARSAASSSRMWAGSGLLMGAMFQLSIIVYIMYI